MKKLKEYKFHYDNKEVGVILACNRNEAYAKAESIAKRLGEEKPFGVKVVERLI
jgi:glutamyl-tRNA reductase